MLWTSWVPPELLGGSLISRDVSVFVGTDDAKEGADDGVTVIVSAIAFANL